VGGVLVLLCGLLLPQAAPCAGSDDISRRLEAWISGQQTPVGTAALDLEALQTFYIRRQFRPLWLGSETGGRRARALLDALETADREGLDPADYATEEIARRLSGPSTREKVELELLLSGELLRYARDLRRGRVNPRFVDPEASHEPASIDGPGLLGRAAQAPDMTRFLRELAPSNPIYRRLRRVLGEYRKIAARGPWPALPEGPNLEAGVSGESVLILRKQLRALGDLTVEVAEPGLFDPGLDIAVRQFQRRHGLDPDGVVGPETRRSLNIPPEERIEQITLNMERWRWMPDDMGERYILVNLAGFDLDVVDLGQVVLSMKVMVGRPYRSTPVFTGRMTYLVFNPYWNVPPRLAREDILPKIRRNPQHLADQGFRVFSSWDENAVELNPLTINWESIDSARFAYKLRQNPGSLNAMGRVKFMLPNSFHVYLHDTPSVHLFEKTSRAFSSGCIRLERPLELTRYLLGDDPAWTRGSIEDAIERGETKTVVLPRPIPVHLTYSTVWFGEGGTVHFRPDLYGRDAALHKALFD
jgi:murein L,D-transpeptidase YcbB/YkuD